MEQSGFFALLHNEGHISSLACSLTAMSTPTGSITSSPSAFQGVWLPAFKVNSDMVQSCNPGSDCFENSWVARKSCGKPTLEPLLLAVRAAFKLRPVVCVWVTLWVFLCLSVHLADPYLVLTGLLGLASDLPHHCGLAWPSLNHWLTLAHESRPVLLGLCKCCAFVGVVPALLPGCPFLSAFQFTIHCGASYSCCSLPLSPVWSIIPLVERLAVFKERLRGVKSLPGSL